jgi:hypothetical protein
MARTKSVFCTMLAVLMVLILTQGMYAATPLLVLVDPESDEAAEIEALGYVPVDNMQSLIDSFDPQVGAFGISLSGCELADWDWVMAQMYSSMAVISFGWDIGEFIENDSVDPTPYADMISIAYSLEGWPIYYVMEGPQDLEDFLSYYSYMNSLYMDYDMDFDDEYGYINQDDYLAMMMPLIMSQGELYINFINQFLQPEWEYKVVTMAIVDPSLEQTLNELGSQGWELVSISGETFIFKCPALTMEEIIEQIYEIIINITENPELMLMMDMLEE